MNWLASKAVGAAVHYVQGTAKGAGGHCTWDFSQCVNPVASIIGTDPITRDGVCEMLSAKWIDEHAHDGHLSNWLMSGGAINPSRVRQLMQWFIIGSEMKPRFMVRADAKTRSSAGVKQDEGLGIQGGEVNQDKATRNFLLSRGIIQRSGGLQNGWGVGSKAGGEKIKIRLAQDICDSRGGTGSYRIIGIYGRDGGGHCMAAWCGLQDVAFFDPNFGEFWFDDKAKFQKWFRDQFYPKSLYSRMMSDRYQLFDYALRFAPGRR